MTKFSSPTPRTVFVRHGETEWSKTGQFTSHTDLPLTPNGRNHMIRVGSKLIGDDPNINLISPSSLTHVFVSPRLRATQTVELLLEKYSHLVENGNIKVIVDDDLKEWEYGKYEGKLTSEIRAMRKSKGLDKDNEWSIWRDGCESGEDFQQVTERLDRVVKRIQNIQRLAIDEDIPCDVLVVAHGHILRCFTRRWTKRSINKNPNFLLDTGGVGVLSYEHHNVEEPAMVLQGAFYVPKEL